MRILFFNILLIINLFALKLPQYFSADFVQKIYSDTQTLTYRGKIYTDGKNVFWKYTYPNEKEIWIKDKVYVYEPDLIQVTIAKKPKMNLFDAIKKAVKIKNDEYTAKINGKTIYFLYDKTLKKAWYKDDVGNRVEILFKNCSTEKLKPSVFNPNYPQDVDVIYQN